MVAYIFDVFSIDQMTQPTQTFVCYSQNLLLYPHETPNFLACRLALALQLPRFKPAG